MPGTKLSFNSLSFLISTGEEPELDIAITIGERSTIEGTINVHKEGWSTTLTGMLLSFASTLTAVFTARSSVAATTNVASSKHSEE